MVSPDQCLVRTQPLLDLPVQLGDPPSMPLDQREEFLQEQAMMVTDMPTQRLYESLALAHSTPQSQISQHCAIFLSTKESKEDLLPGFPHDIRQHR